MHGAQRKEGEEDAARQDTTGAKCALHVHDRLDRMASIASGPLVRHLKQDKQAGAHLSLQRSKVLSS